MSIKSSSINIEKTKWSEIKDKIKKANADFFTIIDELNPSDDYPIYLLKFPYGAMIGDKTSQFISTKSNGLVRLNDSSIPEEIQEDLDYGLHSSPMGMVLSKNFEWYVDLPNKQLTLPIMIQSPGSFFSYAKVLDMKHQVNYSPMGVLSTMSGVRTGFMLPSIGCQNKFIKLSRALKTKLKLPKNLYEHFNLFKSLSDESVSEHKWTSSLIYFSKQWIDNLKNNPEWFKAQKYFYELYLQKSVYLKNLPYYQTAYSLLLESINRSPNPYLFDTFKHLMDIMAGETPGFSPLIDDSFLPLTEIQGLFNDFYGFNNTVPTIIGPAYFNIENNKSQPIYYSLQYPTTKTFYPNSKQSSTMVALKDLRDISQDFITELTKDNNFCSTTIIQNIAKNIDMSFYHNANDIDNVINSIETLTSADKRFLFSNTKSNQVAHDAKFFRGCVKLSHKAI